MRTTGNSQQFLCILFRTFQHVSGLSLPRLEYPNQRAPHLKGYYYVYLREFLAEHEIQLEFACVTSPKPEQEDDYLIMDKACAETKAELDNNFIRTINYCRSYLQVHWLSDICTGDGNCTLDSLF